MAYSFELKDLYELSFLKKENRSRILLPNNLGNIDTEQEIISKDIYLVKDTMNSTEDFNMIMEHMDDKPCMLINVSLQDKFYKYNKTTCNEEIRCPGSIIIEYKNQTKDILKVNKNSMTRGVGIIIKNGFLEKNFFNHIKDKKRIEMEKNCKNSIVTVCKHSSASRKTLSLIKDIYNSPFSGKLQSIYLQSKVNEIIYDELISIINGKDKNLEGNVILSKDDMDALHRAKEIILNGKKHLNISELAKEIAINEKKLSYGFKKLFNTTPGNMILESRMYEAKRLLEESDYNINQVADITGYKYSQNFTKAFVKFFGKKPSDIMKSRSYYY